MIEDQRPSTSTETGRNVVSHYANRRVGMPRFLRNILIGAGISFVLTCIEGALLVFNPLLLFGEGNPQNLQALLSYFLHTPLLWFILLLQVIVLTALVQFADKPLSLLSYIRVMQKAQEQYRARYTSLISWPAIYDRHIIRYQDTPDLSTPGLVQHISILELAQDLVNSPAGSQSNQLILGPRGGGKTTLLYFYQFSALQRT